MSSDSSEVVTYVKCLLSFIVFVQGQFFFPADESVLNVPESQRRVGTFPPAPTCKY